MRQLLFILALAGFCSLSRAADNQPLATNDVSLGMHGILEVQAPKNWTLTYTNLHLRGDPPSVELHSASNTVAIRLTIYWDNFPEVKIPKPTAADLEQIVTNTVVAQY